MKDKIIASIVVVTLLCFFFAFLAMVSAGDYKHLNAECKINESGKECEPGTYCAPFNEQSGNGKCTLLPETEYYSPTPTATPTASPTPQETSSATPSATPTAQPTPAPKDSPEKSDPCFYDGVCQDNYPKSNFDNQEVIWK